MILADALPAVPWSDTTQWIFGACGFLGVVTLIFTVALQARKLFGRTPPIHDELEKRDKALRKMIFASESNLKGRIDKLEQRYEEMQLDRERKWAQLQSEFTEMATTLSYIRGKLDEQEKRRTNHAAS